VIYNHLCVFLKLEHDVFADLLAKPWEMFLVPFKIPDFLFEPVVLASISTLDLVLFMPETAFSFPLTFLEVPFYYFSSF
jgi:hypothetical protein